MDRNYTVMRELLAHISKARQMLDLDDLDWFEPRDRVRGELRRLKADGLIDGVVEFTPSGVCRSCTVTGLTDEGREFWRLVENDAVWAIVRDTLKAADIDVPYPLLKEVCEEIVKRYVTSFIPEIPSNR